jgi:soluble lytic murein transglycosylase-like protein
MRERNQSGLLTVAALVMWGALLTGTAWADGIVAITDGQGRTVYVNTGDPAVAGREVHGGQAAAAATESEVSPAKREDPPAKVHNYLRTTPEIRQLVEQTASQHQVDPQPASEVPPAKRENLPAKLRNPPHTTPEISQLVEQTASRHQVDPQLVHAIIKVESAYDPLAVSNKGAMGLMQLIPATAQELGVANPFDPQENIEGGVTYLRHLLNVFGGDLNLSLAAYNAGEGAVRRYGGVPYFAETRNYVRRVTNIYQSLPSLVGAGDADIKSLPSLAVAGDADLMPPVSAIVRFIDEHGAVHYSNVE